MADPLPPTIPGVLLLAVEGEVTPTGERRYQVGPVPVFLLPATAEGVLVGSAAALARERQHHRDLWVWAVREGHEPPDELAPTGAR